MPDTGFMIRDDLIHFMLYVIKAGGEERRKRERGSRARKQRALKNWRAFANTSSAMI
jgi:hypothetical protein